METELYCSQSGRKRRERGSLQIEEKRKLAVQLLRAHVQSATFAHTTVKTRSRTHTFVAEKDRVQRRLHEGRQFVRAPTFTLRDFGGWKRSRGWKRSLDYARPRSNSRATACNYAHVIVPALSVIELMSPRSNSFPAIDYIRQGWRGARLLRDVVRFRVLYLLIKRATPRIFYFVLRWIWSVWYDEATMTKWRYDT